MKIAVWAEQTIQAGRRAWKIEENEDWENGDVNVFEGDSDHLRKMADMIEEVNDRDPQRKNIYQMNVVKTIREAIEGA